VRKVALLRGAGGILIFLLLWEIAVRSGALRFGYLPPPSAIALAFGRLATTTAVLGEIAHTVSVVLIAWTIAAAIGVAFGAALGLSQTLRGYTMASVEILRPLPPVALVPVALLLFGFSIETELFLITIPAIWPVLIGTMGGVMEVPARLRDVARSMRLRRTEILFHVLIPAAAPSVLVGCRLSMSTALVLAIVVEIIGNPFGLGYAIVREAQALDPAAMFAYVFGVGLLGVIFNAALIALYAVLLPGEFKRRSAAEGA
jgi:sulfonate transport system permease protein